MGFRHPIPNEQQSERLRMHGMDPNAYVVMHAEENGMMRDYSYSYEWDQEYCYPNSNVLINKLNIQDADALHTAEREITSLRLAAAKMQPVKGKFDLRHLQKIHTYLFGDIYDWAGKLRHVNIAKGNQFCLR